MENKTAKVISFTNQKGGCGKTTVNLNVACTMALKRNKKVLLIDLDGQGNLTTGLGFNPDDFEKSRINTFEMLSKRKPNGKDFIVKTKIKGVDLIPSCQKTYTLNSVLLTEKRREYRLNEALEPLKSDYDYIIIDTPPDLGIITFNGLVATNWVILVYTAAEFSIDGISQIMNTIFEIQDDSYLNINNTIIKGAIFNQYRKNTKKVNRWVEKQVDELKNFIPKQYVKISHTTVMEQSQIEHLPILLFNSNNPVSKQYINLVNQIDEE